MLACRGGSKKLYRPISSGSKRSAIRSIAAHNSSAGETRDPKRKKPLHVQDDREQRRKPRSKGSRGKQHQQQLDRIAKPRAIHGAENADDNVFHDFKQRETGYDKSDESITPGSSSSSSDTTSSSSSVSTCQEGVQSTLPKPRLTWRRAGGSAEEAPGAAESAAADATGGQQQVFKYGTGLPLPVDGAQTSSKDPQTSSVPPAFQFSPAQPAPGFFRPQISQATEAECEFLTYNMINRMCATPVSEADMTTAAESLGQQQNRMRADRRQQLPLGVQQQLAAITAAAADALAAAKLRPSGLSEDDLDMAESAVQLAGSTQSVYIAEV